MIGQYLLNNSVSTLEDVHAMKVLCTENYKAVTLSLFGEEMTAPEMNLHMTKLSDVESTLVDLVKTKSDELNIPSNIFTSMLNIDEQFEKYVETEFGAKFEKIEKLAESVCTEEQLKDLKNFCIELTEKNLSQFDKITNSNAANIIPTLLNAINLTESEMSNRLNMYKNQNIQTLSSIPVQIIKEPQIEMINQPQSIESLKQKCQGMLDSVCNYYNINRVECMIGADKDKLPEVYAKCEEIFKQMAAIEDTVTDATTMEEIDNNFRVLQNQLMVLINSYNSNNTSLTSFAKALEVLEVDGNGDAITFKDAFGQEFTREQLAQSLITPEVSKDLDNSKLLNKYPDLVPVEQAIKALGNNVDVQFKEVKGIIEGYVYAQDKPVYKPFYVDLNAVLFNETKKIILLPESGILEDGYVFEITKLDLLTRYVAGQDIVSELEQNDIINDDTRSAAKILDFSTIEAKNRQTVLAMLYAPANVKKLEEAVQNDLNARFKLTKYNNSKNFELVSNSSVRKSFLDGGTTRVTQHLKISNGKATLTVEQPKKK